MPAVSEKQARFMRMVNARQHGHKVGGPKVQKAAKSMKGKDVAHFMHTMGEFKGLPARRKK